MTGSQPTAASNPLVLHPGLLPLVMSFKLAGLEYNNGFKNPRGGLPALLRASFKRETTEAKV